jgi:hypothetical protein
VWRGAHSAGAGSRDASRSRPALRLLCLDAMRRGACSMAVISVLATACVMADIGDGDEAGLEKIEFAADNGIFLDNGLNLSNGMNLGNGTSLANGMNLGNGIDVANGMNLGNGIYAPPAGSGLEQWIDVDPPMRKKILRYLVECALPAGVPVTLTYRGQTSILGRGVAGLGASLQFGMMSGNDQQRVTACMLARINGMGVTVQIDMFGPMGQEAPQFLATGPGDDAYPVLEAAFYGNLFSAEPQAYACQEKPYALADMRSCKDLGGGAYSCGVLAFQSSPCGTLAEQFLQCDMRYIEGSTRAYYNNCIGGEMLWSFVLTTYLAPKPDGEVCFSDDECGSRVCGGGVCVANRLANGEQCTWSSECDSGICNAGACGLASGSYCTSGSQCASNTCSRKHACL